MRPFVIALLVFGIVVGQGSSSVHAVNRCPFESRDATFKQAAVNRATNILNTAKNRLSVQITAVAQAKARGDMLIGRRRAMADNARAVSVGVSARCAVSTIIGILTQNPSAVSFGGRRYSCAAGSVQALIVRFTQAEGLVSEAETTAVAWLEQARTAKERQEERVAEAITELNAAKAELVTAKNALLACQRG